MRWMKLSAIKNWRIQSLTSAELNNVCVQRCHQAEQHPAFSIIVTTDFDQARADVIAQPGAPSFA